MISIPPVGDELRRVGAYFAPLRVSAQPAPQMTVRIEPGSLYTSTGEYIEYQGGNSPTITAPSADAKWVVVVVNENGQIEVHNGTSSSSPVLPTLPVDVLPLAAVYVGDTATQITSDMVFDIRPLWQITPEVVPNLSDELDDRPTFSELNSLLATKADTDGTPSSTFTLNADFVGGPPTLNGVLEVERGANPNVALRWNETTDTWEFTSDGSTYTPISSTVDVVTAAGYSANLAVGSPLQRELGVMYMNSTGFPLTILVTVQHVANSMTAVWVDGVAVSVHSTGSEIAYHTHTVLVPDGSTFRLVNASAGSPQPVPVVDRWFEVQ